MAASASKCITGAASYSSQSRDMIIFSSSSPSSSLSVFINHETTTSSICGRVVSISNCAVQCQKNPLLRSCFRVTICVYIWCVVCDTVLVVQCHPMGYMGYGAHTP
ncbi:unnamed protein product [Orchesella dallaii]|uniref:Uncharacterized protein n=1 Tax=Orchesella dallaii TaxID=48710 RepID=A0ABP1REA1_9HEXA